ncbi:melanocyte-stimulating hormone receptor-like [Oculina patagonica]
MNITPPSSLTCFFLDVNLEKNNDIFTASVLTCILNAVLSVITITSNFIILHVIWKTQELHSPSSVLLFCLATSDLLVGLICQPFFVAYQIAKLVDNIGAYCVLRMIQSISGWTTAGASLAILSAVSVDRLLALTLHLRYNTIVTVQRILQTVFVFWILSVTIVMLRFWIRQWIILPVVIVVTTLIVTTLSTCKIFQIVRRHQRQISQQQHSVQINAVNVFKCRKSAVTVLYVYGLFLMFYIPFLVTMFVETFSGYTLKVKIAYDYATTVVFINSFLNPFVLCWRIGEIRRAVKNLLRRNRSVERITE